MSGSILISFLTHNEFFGIISIGLFLMVTVYDLFNYWNYYNTILYFALSSVIFFTFLLILIFMEVNSGGTDFSFADSGLFIFIAFIFIYTGIRWMIKHQKALVPYDEALKINPNNTAALNNKGVKLAEISEYQEAIKYFDKILEINPNDAAALHNKGVILDKLGKQREAMQYYDNALKIDSGFKKAKNDNKIILEN